MAAARKRLELVIATVIVTACISTHAGFLDGLAFWRDWFSKNKVETLVVTGNYSKARLLAELFQHETKQPILLLSPTQGGGNELYFMPSGPEAMALESGQYVEFINFLQPRRIVFLGNARYTPETYVEQISDSYPTVVMASDNWLKNAEALEDLLGIGNLTETYKSYLLQLENAYRERPVGLSGDVPAGGMSEPMALPRMVVPADSFD